MKKDVGVTSKGENKVGTIPISTAADAIPCIAQAITAVDIGIVIFRQSSHPNVLLTPMVFSFHSPLPCSFPFLLVIPMM